MTDDLTPPHWGTDEFVEPKPGDRFTLDEALSLAVCGYRVRATNMQEGAYIDYQFAGWRINFEGGSSSGWTPRDLDRASEWQVVEDEPKPEPQPESAKWGFTPGAGKPATPEPSKWGEPVVKDKWGRPA